MQRTAAINVSCKWLLPLDRVIWKGAEVRKDVKGNGTEEQELSISQLLAVQCSGG